MYWIKNYLLRNEKNFALRTPYESPIQVVEITVNYIVWFQKISISPPWRELEIFWRGGSETWGIPRERERGGGREWTVNLVFRCPLIQDEFKYTCSSSCYSSLNICI